LVFPSHSAVRPAESQRRGVGLVEIEMTGNKKLISSATSDVIPDGSLNAEDEDFIEEHDEEEADDSTQFITSIPEDGGGEDDKPLVDVDVVIHPRDRYVTISFCDD